ncbi:hypothetical protein [Hominiventricola filiformis]|uniref:Uncharacterized protein n=1 Tax=Hominiventricola filiformis TaxID=2885352 RepID=A0AAE3DAM6_9FIRM|nr:hypothetical protein [Hominiventricola filiformis]MCC2125300.1 hypothetical protein [Hominiventricola filiformis]
MGHIKIDRRILEWEWYKDLNTCRLFFHLLLRANWKDGRFQGMEIPRGSLVTSYNNLAAETGLSVKNVRTALKHLETTGEVAVNRHPKFSVVTVNNYNLYQSDGTINGSQVADNRQTTGKQVATIEEVKKVRSKESNNNIPSAPDDKSPCAGSFLLNDGTSYEITENDVDKFQQLYPGIDVRQEIRNITGWCISNPKNRKTRAGAKRFLNGWLSRAQNSARPNKGYSREEEKTDVKSGSSFRAW